MRPLLAILLLTACATPVTPDARYFGSLTPAVPSDLCKPGKAALRLQNGKALFIPDENTWTLTGTATATGSVEAERIGAGANKQPYSTKLSGTWAAKTASGTYTTPRCTYAVQLTRY
jgi:hypothetical protein